MSDPSVPQKPPFEETEDYAKLERFFELRFSDVDANFMAHLMLRGRTEAIYPDDRDLVKRRAERHQDIQIVKLRAIEDARERYDRGELE